MKSTPLPCSGRDSLRQKTALSRRLRLFAVPGAGWVMRRLLDSLFAAIGILFLGQSLAHSAQFNAQGFSLERVATGLSLPTSIAFNTDGRIFVAEKNGVVRVVENGTLLSAPLVVIGEVNNHRDRGLIGITVDPAFGSNGFIYLAYTYENDPSNPTGPKTARIVRYTVSGNSVVDSSRLVLLGSIGGSPSAPSCADYPLDADCIASDSITHTVGGLRFGPDGKLYVAVGDGAGFNGVDLNAFRAQDVDNLSGKILRIERDGRGVSDNPFYTGNGNDIRSKVWAYGFRNPYRFNFHPLDGRLFGGDVGWATREEVNLILPANNYGWPCREGNAPTGGYAELEQCLSGGSYSEPVYDYLHINRQGAVTGGAFATSATYPDWIRNSYIFADFALGSMQYLTLDTQSNVIAAAELASNVGGPVEIVTSPDGIIYYLSISAGELYKINYVDTSTAAPPVAKASYQTSNIEALTVTFDASESRDSNGTPLDYQWDFGDGNSGIGITPVHRYSQSGSYQVTLTVTAQNSLSNSTTLDVTINDSSHSDSQPFLASLSGPETIKFIGTAISLRATLGNSANGEPFSVQFDITGSDNQSVKTVRLDSIQIPAGTTADYDFSWLPVSTGKFYANVGFYRTHSNHLIQPYMNQVAEFQILARSTPSLSLGGGAIDMNNQYTALIFLGLLMLRLNSLAKPWQQCRSKKIQTNVNPV